MIKKDAKNPKIEEKIEKLDWKLSKKKRDIKAESKKSDKRSVKFVEGTKLAPVEERKWEDKKSESKK